MIVQHRRRIVYEDHSLEPNASFWFKEFRKITHFPFNWHYHPELELTLIVKGRGLRFVAGLNSRIIARATYRLLGSNTPHTLAIPAGPWPLGAIRW